MIYPVAATQITHFNTTYQRNQFFYAQIYTNIQVEISLKVKEPGAVALKYKAKLIEYIKHGKLYDKLVTSVR